MQPEESAAISLRVRSQNVPLAATPLPCYYDTSDPRSSEGSAFCVGCAEWKQTTKFRRGASTCKTCLKIACAACGKNKEQAQYRTEDVYNFLNKKITLSAEHVAERERGSEDRNTRRTKENIAASVVALDVKYTRARQPFGGPKEDA